MELRRSAWPGDDAHEAASRRRVVQGAVLEGLGEALDGGDRRLELVGDVGDEVAPHRLEPLEARHVVEHDDGAHVVSVVVPVQQRAVGLEVALLRPDAHHDVGLHRTVAVQRLRHHVLEVGVADDLLDRLALGRRGIGVQEARGGRVHGDHPLVDVDGEHALDHAGEHRLALVALVGEPAQLVVQLCGHLVDALGHRRELLDARHGQLVREVPGRQALGADLDRAHLSADAPGHVQADDRGDHRDDDRTHGDAPVEGGERVVHAGERDGRAHDGREAAVLGDGHGDVHHLLPQRPAVPDRPARLPLEGRPDLGTGGVALHLQRVGVRVGQDFASAGSRTVHGDERDARSRRLAQPLHERLELLPACRR